MRQKIFKDILDHDVCLTTYEMCLRSGEDLLKLNWEYMIVDEGHRLKNEDIKLLNILRKLHTKNRILLTGTPFQNTLHELWALLNFVEPTLFPQSDEFDEKFTERECARNALLIEHLQNILKPLMLRRLKSNVAKELKPKIEFVERAQLSNFQKEKYMSILHKNLHIINAVGKVVKRDINNLTMELRKCSNHPKLMDEQIIFHDPQADIVNNCGKMKILHKLLSELKTEGSRVLIFSQMRRMLDIIEEYCKWCRYDYCRLDGRTKNEERAKLIYEYNKTNSRKFIFMLTTRAGGLGINLSSADVVIIYDLDWNPQADLQAIDRVHRIGQTGQVRVYRLTTVDTIEERIMQRTGAKLHLDDLIIQKGKYTHSTTKEMLNVIRSNAKKLLGAQAIQI